MLYKSILKEGVDQFEEKKSIFIGYSQPVEKVDLTKVFSASKRWISILSV